MLRCRVGAYTHRHRLEQRLDGQQPREFLLLKTSKTKPPNNSINFQPGLYVLGFFHFYRTMKPNKPRAKRPVVNAANIDKILRSLSERGQSPTSVILTPDGYVTLVLDGQGSSPDAQDIELREWEADHR